MGVSFRKASGQKSVVKTWKYILFKCLKFFFLKSHTGSAIKRCQTTNEPGSKVKNSPCKFPFTNNGKKYDSCTTDNDPDGRFWCSTKVDQSGNHQKGNWGYCSRKCYDEIKCQTTNEPGVNVKNAPCKFPFTIGTQTFDTCTSESDPEGRLWCSTRVDRFGRHLEGNWGYCSDGCAGALRKLKNIL